MKTFTVGTFYNGRSDDKRPVQSLIQAYTLWYNPSWDGCIIYKVQARTGAEAKKTAIRLRLEREVEKWAKWQKWQVEKQASLLTSSTRG